MKGTFQGSVNRTVHEKNGNAYVQVGHKGQLYRVEFARTESELAAVKALDDQYFPPEQQLTNDELRIMPQCGHVLYFREKPKAPMLGACQILFQSITRQEVRMHEAFSFGTVGRGFGQILYKAQEIVAREAGKKLIRSTVRLENTESIRSHLKSGYRITEYDPTRYGLTEEGGARLIMVKDLINEQLPFRPDLIAPKVINGDIPILSDPSKAPELLANQPFRLGIFVKNIAKVNLEIHQLLQAVMQEGYTGIALILPMEIGEAGSDRYLLIFHRKDAPPDADRLSLPVNVHSEFGRLREVIVSFTPENAQIRAEFAINDVAKKNVNNIDPISFREEYKLFVGTLIDQGVKVVHTNAIGKEGKSAIFTRDPAMSIGNTFVIGNLRQAQRVYELEGMREVASDSGYLDISDARDGFVEGGDVIFIGEKKLAVGLGQRSSLAGLKRLQAAFPEYEFVGVPHDELHLDVLFTVVGHKKCLADVTRLTDLFLEMLKTDGYTIIVADPDEQVTLGCNVVCISDHKVIAVKENAETIRRLRKNGVDVVEVSMPNVIKWGGGPRCMTCPTHRGL